jgi:hypothetical protein
MEGIQRRKKAMLQYGVRPMDSRAPLKKEITGEYVIGKIIQRHMQPSLIPYKQFKEGLLVTAF